MGEGWFNENILYGCLAENLDAEELGMVVKYLSQGGSEEDECQEPIEFNDDKLFTIAYLARVLKKICS